MAKTYNGPERRKYPRAGEKMLLVYHEANGGSLDHLSKDRKSVTEDIGGGGICFETDVFVPADSIVEVRIKKAADRKRKKFLPVSATGKVVWVKQLMAGRYRLGLQFLDIDETCREEITKDVEEKLTQKQ